MKKLLIATASIILTSTSAYAQGADDFSGPYIGGSIGYNSFNSDALAENIGGLTFGGLGGFRSEISDGVYLGAEAFLNFSTASRDFGIAEIEVKESYGFTGQIGVEAGNSLLFANAGYGWTTIGNNVTSVTSKDGGIRLGAGIETKLANLNGFRPRLEVNWQDFDGASSLGVAAVFLFGF